MDPTTRPSARSTSAARMATPPRVPLVTAFRKANAWSSRPTRAPVPPLTSNWIAPAAAVGAAAAVLAFKGRENKVENEA